VNAFSAPSPALRLPPRSASNITPRSPHSENVMSLTGWLWPERAISCGLTNKSGITNSRRTSETSNDPSGASRTDQTALRFSSSDKLLQSVLPNAGLLHVA
jgi:hypothetical protein